jgi:hypothetical protein
LWSKPPRLPPSSLLLHMFDGLAQWHELQLIKAHVAGGESVRATGAPSGTAHKRCCGCAQRQCCHLPAHSAKVLGTQLEWRHAHVRHQLFCCTPTCVKAGMPSRQGRHPTAWLAAGVEHAVAAGTAVRVSAPASPGACIAAEYCRAMLLPACFMAGAGATHPAQHMAEARRMLVTGQLRTSCTDEARLGYCITEEALLLQCRRRHYCGSVWMYSEWRVVLGNRCTRPGGAPGGTSCC